MSITRASQSVRSADGTRIAFDQVGDGRPPLILVEPALHYRDFSSFGGLVPLLSQDFSVYAYDRRGRGESTDTTPYSPDREVEDLEALLAQVGGWAHLYGYSSELCSRCALPLRASRFVEWRCSSHPSRTMAPGLRGPI